MHEIELKYQVPARRRAAVARAVAGTPIQLQAAYVDTVERDLAAAGLALRMRREGRAWVQTLKGEAGDGLTRLEHNVTLPARGSAVPAVDPARHAGTEAGEMLAQALRAAAQPALTVLYRTDIRRSRRLLDTAHGQVELAFDEGFIEAAGSRLPVCELEIELVSGTPMAVLATAREWMAHHGLWLDTRSKAERGDRLSRGGAAATRQAAPVAPEKRATPAEAWRGALQGCWRQVAAQASEMAGETGDPDALHGLRVGLRRLLSLQRLLQARGEPVPAWREPARGLLRKLGPARDIEALSTAVWPRVRVALAQAGGVVVPAQAAALVSGGPSPAEVVRDTQAQALLLDLLEAMSSPVQQALPSSPSLRKRLGARLQRWHDRVVSDLRRFHKLDERGRHTLRKRIKRLRYATEWAAPLYPSGRVRRYLAALRDAQTCLGDIGDTTLAWHALRGEAEGAAAMFTLGWLSAEREALLAAAPERLATLGKVGRYWRGAD